MTAPGPEAGLRDPDATGDAPGTPRSSAAASQLARFEAAMALPLVLAAVLPILMWLVDRRTLVATAIYVVSWIVFVVDLAVHMRLLNRYLLTRRGRFDLVVVVLTGPWVFVPVLGQSKFLIAVRLARVVRVILVTKHARRLVERLGRAVVVFVAVVFACSYIAYHAERLVNTEFKNYADALWWAVVTICTVGYGDITPVTAEGRWAGVILMVTGIGIIGALAGSLASFLRLAPPGPTPPGPTPPGPTPPGPTPPGPTPPGPTPPGPTPPGPTPAAATVDAAAGIHVETLTDEIASLRADLVSLKTHLDRLATQAARPHQDPGDDPSAAS